MALDEREKQAARCMRLGGLGYKAIAARLAVSRDQIRAYVTRTGIEPTAKADPDGRWCRWWAW